MPEVQAVLRHAAVRVEEIFDACWDATNSRAQVSYPTGYTADDIAAVFGA
ncbi:hypothetical protein [Streptomyces sp. NPDC017095]